MERGRPIKFQCFTPSFTPGFTPSFTPSFAPTVEELEKVGSGNVVFYGERFSFDDFNSERDLIDYIVSNINLFVKEYLNDSLVSFEVDMPINKQIRLSPRGRRIDLFIKGKRGVYIVEAKNGKNTNEIRQSIGQILDYGREFLDPKKEMILVSTTFDMNTAKTIKYYNLPIRYIIFSKDRGLELNI
jgi:hypothetical protein